MKDVKKACSNVRMSSSNVRMSSVQQSVNIFLILQLPHSILMHILSSLPIKTVMNCMCVCKQFLFIISDPYFAKLHLSRSPIGILIKTMPKKNKSRRLQLAQVFDKGGDFMLEFEKMTLTLENNIPAAFDLANACNGFICLYSSSLIYVCNPILGEYIKISAPRNEDPIYSYIVGFGYSAASDHYKLIQIQNEHCFVQTIGTGVWRSICKLPSDLCSMTFNCFLNGALHWRPVCPCCSYTKRQGKWSLFTKPEVIWSFNFDNEEFIPIPLPSYLLGLEETNTEYLCIGVLEGCLYVSFFEGDRQLHIWVMKEYGVKESWSWNFFIEDFQPNSWREPYYEPMLILRNREMLMYYCMESIVLYNKKYRDMTKMKFFGTPSEFIAIAYTPCFVPLSHVAKGEVSKIKRIRRTRERKSATVTPPTE